MLGKAYYDAKKSLKQHKIMQEVAIQILDQEENLEKPSQMPIQLVICQRDANNKTYINHREVPFFISNNKKGSKLSYLLLTETAKALLDIQGKVQIAKYQPGKFKWEEIIYDQEKENDQSFLHLKDLTKQPYFIKEGDVIAIRLENEQDDWQTEEDNKKRQEFEKNREATRALFTKDKKQKKPEVGIHIGDF